VPVTEELFLGIDLGTSACRVALIDVRGKTLALASAPLAAPRREGERMEQDPAQWWAALEICLADLRGRHGLDDLRALAVDATSGSVLLSDSAGQPLHPALMYGDSRARDQARRIAAFAPADRAARGAGSGLARAMWLLEQLRPQDDFLLLHQADWISGRLSGQWGVSDYNNALKTGYESQRLAWPDWIGDLGMPPAALPRVQAPGTPIGAVDPAVAQRFGLPKKTAVVAGTTDSVAAFLATGACAPGDAVSALGSTLALKLVSPTPVFDAAHGVYSHRLGDLWLAGGASNSGGAVLLEHFTLDEIERLTPLLTPDVATGLAYYPLARPGERFPVNDPDYPGRIEPVPEDRVKFLQGLLEGIADIERRGYELLQQLGAPRPARVFTTGGGHRNPAWGKIRERMLGIPLADADSEEAAVGAARLAAGPALNTTTSN